MRPLKMIYSEDALKDKAGRREQGMKNILFAKFDRAWSRLMNRMAGSGIKTAGDSHFMSVLVTIIIVLVIAVMYRENISTIFTNFFTKSTTQINALFP